MSKIKTDPESKPDRKHCRSCTYYLDGRQEVKDDGVTLHFHPIPGMRHYRFSTGTIYDKIGTTVPCTCPAGQDLEKGFDRNDGRFARNTVFKAWFTPANQKLIQEDLLPAPEIAVPMGAATEREF